MIEKNFLADSTLLLIFIKRLVEIDMLYRLSTIYKKEKKRKIHNKTENKI